jgi:hypothetical protein
MYVMETQTFEIRRSKNRPFGRIELKPVNDLQIGLFFYLGPHPRGFRPIPGTGELSLELGRKIAEALVVGYARQQSCRWVVVDGVTHAREAWGEGRGKALEEALETVDVKALRA